MPSFKKFFEIARVIRTEIIWTLVGSVATVWLVIHILPGMAHSVFLDAGIVLLIAAVVMLYDILSHRHDDDFGYHIDHLRLESACHLDPDFHHHTDKTPGNKPGVSNHKLTRKFNGRE